MGGFGSGRTSYATTPTVEACRSLDSDSFSDVVDDPTVSHVTCSWGDDNIRAAVEHSDDEHADGLRLLYTTRRGTDAAQEYDYRVSFEYTECNFGGVRPWFSCPGCGTRRGKLYLRPRGGRFACRECHDLGYRSSRHSGNALERAEQRYRKAFAKADKDNRRPHPNSFQSPYRPEKPAGMHWDTYDDLLADVDRAREEWADVYHARLFAIAGGAGVERALGSH